MTPKFIELTRRYDKCKIMVNPRRLNSFYSVQPPSQYPDLFCGTMLDYGSKREVVNETVDEIKKMLK